MGILQSDVQEGMAVQPGRRAESEQKLKFGGSGRFQTELRRRVDDYFRAAGRRKRDCWQMYLKTGIFIACLAFFYALLVFWAHAWWQALPLALLIAVAMAGIGFNVQHDGGHEAYSDRPWINRSMAMTMDLVGGSSYLWRWKHGVFHHTFVNITGHDTDVDLGIFGRLTPHQRRYAFHRWQHFYLWPLYGFLAAKWALYDDFRDVIIGRIGDHKIPRPRGGELAGFIGGKAVFLTLAFGLPLAYHSFLTVSLFYILVAFPLGFALSLVFQLAHAVEEADFPMPDEDTGRIENAWAIHQVQTTVNFARGSRTLSWLLGGLNFQIEHHLFPRICHIHYPALSKVVEETCREFGIRYAEHKTFMAGVASHYRWLRWMGTPDADA